MRYDTKQLCNRLFEKNNKFLKKKKKRLKKKEEAIIG